ncbi:MAG: hypothetical protein NVS9B4_27940 [Candidatus Acidiferrum sp.]
MQEYVLGFPKSPWIDLLRVDVLNIIGLSMILMGLLCWATTRASGYLRESGAASPTAARSRMVTIIGALSAAAIIALATPPLWTTHRPTFLPWFLESYFNGVHVYDRPQVWLFPMFPWASFAFVGLALGCSFLSPLARKKESRTIAFAGGAGVVAVVTSLLLDAWPHPLFAVYDYWHTSPNFFLLRCGVLLILMFLIYAWCRWGLAQKGFSPVIQLGKTSLLVYWVHIEFVYGRLSILPKGRCGIPLATTGLAVIVAAMVALSVWRTRWKKKRSHSAIKTNAPASEAAI